MFLPLFDVIGCRTGYMTNDIEHKRGRHAEGERNRPHWKDIRGRHNNPA